MTGTTGGLDMAAEQRARIENAFAAYPHIEPAALDELLHWYRREASAYDVAMIASNERLAEGYRRFRAERIDPIRWRDILRVLAFAALAGGGIWAMLALGT